jgi:hypothetical protein
MPSGNETILATVSIIFALLLVVFAISYQSTPTSTISMNITIVEKYPVHSYQEMCGKGTMCTYTDPPKIIDNKGDLYIVQSEDNWAKMQINKTYNVMYASYPNVQKGKIVGINY